MAVTSIGAPAAGLLGRARDRAGTLGGGAYAALLSFTVLALAGSIGLAAQQPWVFPSLGATVLLVTAVGWGLNLALGVR